MTTWKGRIRGTINDDFEVEAETEEEAIELARDSWTYVEFEDLTVDDIYPVERDEP